MPLLPISYTDVSSEDSILDSAYGSDQEITDAKFPPNPREVHGIPPPMSFEPGSDDSDSQMALVRTATPTPRLQIHVYDPKKNNWGHTSRTRKSGCDGCSSGKESHGFACSTLGQQALDQASQGLLTRIRHFLNYLYIDDALKPLKKKTDQCVYPDTGLPVPSIMMAMGLDWDTTCAHPFLKRLLNFYQLEEEIVCVEGSENDGNINDGIDMTLRLKGSFWRAHQTKCDAFNFIPICPIMVHKSSRDDSMDRLRKWCLDYFDCLEQNQTAYVENRWPLPYFVVDGSCWRVGFAIKVGSAVELYDELIGYMGWGIAVRKVMVVLQHVIKSTVDRHREWYLEHGN
ncbi:hypothetical protein KCU98_g3027, partial [Aureobasidium melanogenum]